LISGVDMIISVSDFTSSASSFCALVRVSRLFLRISFPHARDRSGPDFARTRRGDLSMDSRTALQASEFEVACDLVSDVVLTLGVDQVIRYANGACRRVLGWAPRELVGQPLSALIPTRFQAEHHGHVQAFGESNAPSQRVRLLTARRRDGVEVPLEAQVSRALVDCELCFVVTLHDIADRVEHEREVKQFEQRLARIERLESLATLSAGVAHDFNNTLTVVLALTRAVKQELPEDSEASADLGEVLKAATRAADLTRRLLTFGRLGQSQVTDVDVSVVLNDVARLARATANGVEVITSIPAGLPTLRADESLLGQALLNLATNALYAMKHGGGTLVLSATAVTFSAPRTCTTRTLPAGSWLRLTVSDSGAGIAPDALANVFEPFFTTKPVGEGTGLGLAMVHGMVHGARGAIDLTSTVGVGTTFDVYLPAAGGPATEAAAPKEARRGSRRILLVAADLYVCAALQRGLTLMGHACHCVSSPRDAWTILRTDPGAFDALVTDEELPMQSGLELSALVHSTAPQLQIVAMSGRTLTEEEREHAGVACVVPKPTSALAVSEALALPLRLA
jgi:PAS domain S-box-containing protein